MNLDLHLRILGVLLTLLAFVHLGFPRFLGWRDQLKPLSLLNRQIMQIHTLFIALTVLLMGLLCLGSASELSRTVLGRRVALGMAFFWLVRLACQFFAYSPELWRGKRVETIIHILASLLWLDLTATLLFAGLSG